MDILLDENKNLRIENGDFVIGESEQQEIELLLTSFKGSWKESPEVGIGIKHLLKSRDALPSIKREINIQLAADGFKVKDINIDYPNIEIDATRK